MRTPATPTVPGTGHHAVAHAAIAARAGLAGTAELPDQVERW